MFELQPFLYYFLMEDNVLVKMCYNLLLLYPTRVIKNSKFAE